jgi:hypothetical protein
MESARDDIESAEEGEEDDEELEDEEGVDDEEDEEDDAELGDEEAVDDEDDFDGGAPGGGEDGPLGSGAASWSRCAASRSFRNFKASLTSRKWSHS